MQDNLPVNLTETRVLPTHMNNQNHIGHQLGMCQPLTLIYSAKHRICPKSFNFSWAFLALLIGSWPQFWQQLLHFHKVTPQDLSSYPVLLSGGREDLHQHLSACLQLEDYCGHRETLVPPPYPAICSVAIQWWEVLLDLRGESNEPHS